MIFHSTVIFVKDIEVSKIFYTRYLGFSIINDFGNNVMMSNGLSIWEIQKEHIIAKKLKTNIQSNRFELYFETDNINEIFNKLNSSGIKFLHNIHEESWGQKTIRFFDTDNHLIEIGEQLDIFVKNMSKKGLTPNQISDKSGIPVETVITLIQK